MTIKTIKLPIVLSEENKEFILLQQKKYSFLVGKLYQKLKSNLSQKEVTDYLNSLDTDLDSWFKQSAFYEAKGMLKADVETYEDRVDEWLSTNKITDKKKYLKKKPKLYRLFGGKKNRKYYDQGKITKEAYQLRKLLPFTSIGEAPQSGNRKFKLDIDNSQIIFKFNRSNHILLPLPKLRNNYQKELTILEQLAENKCIPFTVKLTTEYIAISYEEQTIEKIDGQNILGIDLNPNYIGISIQMPNREILFTQLFDISKLTESNKQQYELSMIAKELIYLGKIHKIKSITIEDLSIKSQEYNQGKAYNKLVNNKWNKNYFINCIKRRAKIYGIVIKEVKAFYSSTIGNMLYRNYSDPVASSIEIGRRGIDGETKYPEYNLNKEALSIQMAEIVETCLDWITFHNALKKSKMRYRVPLPDRKVFKTFQNHKSLVHYDSGFISNSLN